MVLALWVHTITYGEGAVAVGTLALAGITGYLGIETRATARAAREAVESSEEPFVIATPTDALESMFLRKHELPQSGTIPPFTIHRAVENDGESHFVRLKLWNIGLGPAIVEQVSLRRSDENYIDGLPRFYTLGTDRAADTEIPSSRWRESCAALLTIGYRHASGRRYETNSDVTIKGNLVDCVTYVRTRVEDRR
jgi:hypothetical protein